MNDMTIAALHACAAGSLAGTMTFPQVVQSLGQHGVERYHVDLSRGEKTYYLPSGDSHVERLEHDAHAIASAFDAAAIEQAIRAIQRGEIQYRTFLARITAAGCVGYFVQLTGRCAQYLGRNGEVHVEPFPRR